MSAFPSTADMLGAGINVGKVPEADFSTCSTAIDGAWGASCGLRVRSRFSYSVERRSICRFAFLRALPQEV
jgi:hypothetical protein